MEARKKSVLEYELYSLLLLTNRREKQCGAEVKKAAVLPSDDSGVRGDYLLPIVTPEPTRKNSKGSKIKLR